MSPVEMVTLAAVLLKAARESFPEEFAELEEEALRLLAGVRPSLAEAWAYMRRVAGLVERASARELEALGVAEEARARRKAAREERTTEARSHGEGEG